MLASAFVGMYVCLTPIYTRGCICIYMLVGVRHMHVYLHIQMCEGVHMCLYVCMYVYVRMLCAPLRTARMHVLCITLLLHSSRDV